eukprot:7766275-Pyramimonas_sp.AAC.1
MVLECRCLLLRSGRVEGASVKSGALDSPSLQFRFPPSHQRSVPKPSGYPVPIHRAPPLHCAQGRLQHRSMMYCQPNLQWGALNFSVHFNFGFGFSADTP